MWYFFRYVFAKLYWQSQNISSFLNSDKITCSWKWFAFDLIGLFVISTMPLIIYNGFSNKVKVMLKCIKWHFWRSHIWQSEAQPAPVTVIDASSLLHNSQEWAESILLFSRSTVCAYIYSVSLWMSQRSVTPPTGSWRPSRCSCVSKAALFCSALFVLFWGFFFHHIQHVRIWQSSNFG